LTQPGAIKATFGCRCGACGIAAHELIEGRLAGSVDLEAAAFIVVMLPWPERHDPNDAVRVYDSPSVSMTASGSARW